MDTSRKSYVEEKRKAEGDVYSSIADRRGFGRVFLNSWEEFWGPAGCRLERRGGDWGRGLMTEAVQQTIRFCFDIQGIDALTVGHFIDNKRSRRVIEKCGFQYFGPGEFYSSQLQKSFPEMRYILLNPLNTSGI